MALDPNAVKFLLWAKNRGVSFERTLTLGRQGFACTPALLKGMLRDFNISASEQDVQRCCDHAPGTMLYSDEFLRFCGAKNPVSADYSDFEGATLLHDLNKPFPAEHHSKFDIVYDGGTLEHIFDFPRALTHCLELVRPGGHFVTVTPANNFMGHGFYQFSPELFFRVFSPENGFKLKTIVLYEAFRANADFYEVKDPAATGLRTELKTAEAMVLGVMAERLPGVPLLGKPIQQSEYAALWEVNSKADGAAKSNGGAPSRMRQLRLAMNPYLPNWLKQLKRKREHRQKYGPPSFSNQKHFRKVDWSEVVRKRD
jgi:SAM-dependent methyltransferase